MNRQGVVLVVCAPSGTGKTSLVKRLLQDFPALDFSVSCTTRAPRPGEVDGRDYYFISREEFMQKRSSGEFAEWAEVYGNLYGTLLKPTRERIDAGQDLIFDIDVQGAAQLHLTLPHGKFVFILPPDLPELEKRLQNRGSENEEVKRLRLEAAKREIGEAHWFNAWVVNDDFEKAYEQLRSFYVASTLSPRIRPSLLNYMLEGNRLKCLS